MKTFKFVKVKFKNHPILENLVLDFRGQDGKTADTIIFAGENGAGKSTILDALYRIACGKTNFDTDIDVEIDGKELHFVYYKNSGENIYRANINNSQGTIESGKMTASKEFIEHYIPQAIFSDVDINFKSADVQSVTSNTLDSNAISRRSDGQLPQQIIQLMVDIQALDAETVMSAVNEAKGSGISVDELKYDKRMERFTNAFAKMFDDLIYQRVDNKNNHKEIIFAKSGKEFPISRLSSGEKQIVYRGCFLLKDVNALRGAVVFIDEPEISLHPIWQKKIMNYYKDIFTNGDGIQTSQIFVVTHSPFIIHNDMRRDDKVIVLHRDKNGKVMVIDKPEYYKCNSLEVVEDAFEIKDFDREQSTVFLEGRTDQMYFEKAVNFLYGGNYLLKFKWVGHLDDNGNEVNTGKDALDKVYHFLVAQNLSKKMICLKDCDTNSRKEYIGNCIRMSLPKFNNDNNISRGIENALVLNDVDRDKMYVLKDSIGDYGEEKHNESFEKMKLCEYICGLDNEQDKDKLGKIFVNFKNILDDLCNEL